VPFRASRLGSTPPCRTALALEQEGGREHDRGGHQGCADAREGTYSSDDGSSGQLPQRVRPVAYRDDRRPHAGFESPVDPGQVQGVERLAGQASELESAQGECEATGQREGDYPHEGERVQDEEQEHRTAAHEPDATARRVAHPAPGGASLAG
jgi:hypothetical protein